jgi:hypothetical protein
MKRGLELAAQMNTTRVIDDETLEGNY